MASVSRSAGLGVPMRRRSRRHSSGCHWSPGWSRSPSSHDRSIWGRWTLYRSKRSATWRTLAKRRVSPAGAALTRWARRGASHGSSRLSATTSSSGHTERAGAHGSVLGSIPPATASAAPMIVPGKGHSTLAHTPSWPPGLVPRWSDSCWVSHRSTPRVGTATTSAVSGSSSGVARSWPSMATSPSARSERWRWSTHGKPTSRVSHAGPGGDAGSGHGYASARPGSGPDPWGSGGPGGHEERGGQVPEDNGSGPGDGR